MNWIRIALLSLMVAGTPPSFAQAPADSSPSYEPQLLRLSEILGSVQFLRELCGTNEGSLWRDQMQALIDSGEPDLVLRSKMIDRYNRGYESYRSVYRVCTEAARLSVDRYLQEGAQISEEIAARYGG